MLRGRQTRKTQLNRAAARRANPLFRFISRFVVGHHKTIDDYQADLARKLDGA